MNDPSSLEFLATDRFWKSFYALPAEQKESTRAAWKLFQQDPFHSVLRSHKIHALSGRARETVYSAVIEGDLRALFVVRGRQVITLDIGTHAIYR